MKSQVKSKIHINQYIGVLLILLGLVTYISNNSDTANILMKLIPDIMMNRFTLSLSGLITILLVYTGYRLALRVKKDSILHLSIVIFFISILTLNLFTFGMDNIERYFKSKSTGLESIYCDYSKSNLWLKDVEGGQVTLVANLALENLGEKDIPVDIQIILNEKHNDIIREDKIVLRQDRDDFILKAKDKNVIESEVKLASKLKSDYGYINLDYGFTIKLKSSNEEVSFIKR